MTNKPLSPACAEDDSAVRIPLLTESSDRTVPSLPPHDETDSAAVQILPPGENVSPIAQTVQNGENVSAVAETVTPGKDVSAVVETVQKGEEYSHVPVLLTACTDALRIRPGGVYVDGTLGRAGHAREIVRRLTTGRLIGIDRDPAAIEHSRRILNPWRERVTLVRGNFADLDILLARAGVELTDGMIFDLGVSSPQLDDPARGFSYRTEAPLDMRMDTAQSLTARDIVNTWSEEHLRRILFDYGEERYAPLIAAAIVRRRIRKPFETTVELAETVRQAVPARALREKQHPAKRTFQAIRIAVNGELDALNPMIQSAVRHLAPGGRLAVITFHSLEDRIVKRAFRELSTGCTCPPGFPVCVCGKVPQIRLVNRKPVTPGEEELSRNPRARSAKLRIAERCIVTQPRMIISPEPLSL